MWNVCGGPLRPLCNKTKLNCAPSTTFPQLTGRASERQIQSSPLCQNPPPDKVIKGLPGMKGHASHDVQTRPMPLGKPAAHKRLHSPRRRQQWHQIPRRRTPNPTRNCRRLIKGLTPELTIARSNIESQSIIWPKREVSA